MNAIQQLTELGQSVWYDQMTRSLLTEGTLETMIREDGLGGLTSNPTIFEKAIADSGEYESVLQELAREGRSAEEIYDAIVLEDIAGAADAFREMWEQTGGEHGYVSLEVSPRLAHDTAGTVAEARRYHAALGRPNVMIKVPATPEGIPAIETLIGEGIPVNVTLIFSNEMYDKVIEAYINGIERRITANESPDVPSVASFFVSRIDSKADAALDGVNGASHLKGTIAIANAKVAYQNFLEKFGDDRFARLEEAGARVQRPLWASTSTKNPDYRDVLYVEALIGPDTVDTLPPATYEAFKDHGVAKQTINTGLEKAREQLAELTELGIDLDEITHRLMIEGVASFAKSFDSLMTTIEKRRADAA